MRVVLVWAAVLLAGCAPAPAPRKAQSADPTREPWYAEATGQLAALNREAETLLGGNKPDEAAARITDGEPLANRLLSAPRPTLAATEAAADHDDLYGRMLLTNRNYGWARLLFQKNLTRWKNWKPQTPDTERRRERAESQIAECDRHLLAP